MVFWGQGSGVELCTHPAPPLGTPEPFLPLALDPDGSWLYIVPFSPSPPVQAWQVRKDGIFHLCCATLDKLVTCSGPWFPLIE